MAKKDLIFNPDFIEYQKDLQKRLEGNVKILHDFAILPCQDKAALEENLITYHSQKAVIAENEAILLLPEKYVPKEQRSKTRNKMMPIIYSIWRKVFTHNGK